jgi:MFS family permease
LLISVFDRHGGAAVGWLLLVSTAPRLLGPVLGAVADRFDQRRLMVGCDLAQAVIYAALALAMPSLPVLLALTAAGTGCATLFTPAGRCLVPRMVGMDRVPAANAQLAVAMNAGLAAGPALGGILLATTGLTATLLVNAATFVGSALLLAAPGFRTTTDPDEQEDGRPELGVGGLLRDGLVTAWGNRVVRMVSLLLLFAVVFAALDNVAVVPFGRGVLHAGDALVGTLGTGYGVGMVIAPVLLSMRRSYRPHLVLLLAMLAFGIGTLATGLTPVLWLALAGQALAGAGNGWENVANDTLIQQHVPAHRLGTVFGTVYTFPYAAEVLAYTAGGPLLAHLGPRWVLGIAGGGVLATLALGYPFLSRAVRRSIPAGGKPASGKLAGETPPDATIALEPGAGAAARVPSDPTVI